MKRKLIYCFRKALLYFANRGNRKLMLGDLKEIFRNNATLKNEYKESEQNFIARWSALDSEVSPLAYRFYSTYIGPNADIVPPDVARQYIEPVLNASEYDKFYSDKNSFGLFIDAADMPKTLFRSMGYKLYDGEYNAVHRVGFDACFASQQRVIVKPAKDLGGHGIEFYERKDGVLKNKDGEILTLEGLERTYKTDYLIQECFVQSDYISQFNPTSVNTIRINTYRDIKTGQIHILGAALRIGAKGSNVDNATSGGVIVGVDENGKLGSVAYDKYGNATSEYNDIDLAVNEFVIPNFEAVKQFAIKITKRLPHMRLLALDVVLDKTNNPKLIEVNCNNFSVKFLQLTKGPVFGEYTDDIIEYCKENKNHLSVGFYIAKRE